MRTCDYVFIGLVLLFVGVLAYRAMNENHKETFSQVASCGSITQPQRKVEIVAPEEEEAQFVQKLSHSVENFHDMVEDDADHMEASEESNTYVAECCAPQDMCDKPHGDATFEVYDRKIGQISKSRNYDAGDKIRGDLFICPARPTDAHGSDWFRPSHTNGVLNAGALRFISSGGNNGFTNIQGDDIFNHGGKSSNVDAQYAPPSC